LIRLLSIGLRVLTLLEFGVRRRLAAAKTTLGGLYVGNPKRATAHPTAERLLEAFQGLTLTIIREGRRRRRHLTPLSRVHQRLLALLDFSVDIYTRLWLPGSNGEIFGAKRQRSPADGAAVTHAVSISPRH